MLAGGKLFMKYLSTILIVDDELGGRKNLEGLLIGHGYNLAFAENGPEALAKASELLPDLILLDVMMPGMDGFEVCQRLRSDSLLAEVPILMVTALDDRSFRLKGIEAGADDFISKPFDRTELRTRVKSILRLNRYRSLLLERIKFERLFELSPNGVVIVNAEGIIHLANPKTAEIFHVQDNSVLLGRKIFDFIAKECKDELSSYFDGLINTSQQIKQVEITMLRSDCTTFIAEVDASNFIWDGEETIQIIVRDITEKKKLEAQFLRVQRLDNIGALASGVAHDLNNILSPILMSFDILRKRIPDARTHSLLNLLEENTHRGAELVKQVLSFGRGLENKQTNVDIKNIIWEIDRVLKETFPKLITIEIKIAEGLLQVKADVTQIHQILMNLCINARDAMLEGGCLVISAYNFEIDETYAETSKDSKIGKYIVISVSDSGTGIPPEIIDKIYEPFFTTKEIGKGTGLGLSTVNNIVTNHGGFIKVNSTQGKGTEFKVYLPAVKTMETVVITKPTTKSGNGELILVVDDEAAIREITKSSLEVNNYKVITASDGIEAITLCAKHKEEIALVITDMMMPILDCSKTILTLQKINPTINIIVISGIASTDKVKELEQLGIKKFLQKPYSLEVLLNAVQSVLV